MNELNELQESWEEAERSLSLEKEKNSLFTSEIGQLREELEKAKVELAELHQYKANEGKRRAKEKKVFLESEDFFDLLGHCAIFTFKYGFDGPITNLKRRVTHPKESLLLFSV